MPADPKDDPTPSPDERERWAASEEAMERLERAVNAVQPLLPQNENDELYFAVEQLRAALLRAERQEPVGERVEGWADTTEADCSCARARTIHFNADCGHGDWGQRATLIIHAEPEEEER